MARDGEAERNRVWKDTVLVGTGEVVDILLDHSAGPRRPLRDPLRCDAGLTVIPTDTATDIPFAPEGGLVLGALVGWLLRREGTA